MKILLIEDDPLISRMYTKAFTQAGYEVELAADGEAGLQKAGTVNPTLILLDVMMPKMNGIQVLESLKKNPATNAIPVVMLTNLSNQQDMEHCFNKGAIEFLTKSAYEPSAIVTRINEILHFTQKEVPQNAKPLQ